MRRSILLAKSVIFQEKGKTHHNITILTVCKIYNINNNKIAYIQCFYYYIDEKTGKKK